MIVRDRISNAFYVRLYVVLLFTYISFQLSEITLGVIAYPSSAGSCFAADSAVRGIHTSRATIVKNTLSDLNINLHVGSFLYVDNSTIPLLQGVEYTISVDAIEPAFFRGILIRFQALEGQDLNGSVSPDENTKVSAVCIGPEVAGLEHFDRSLKTRGSGKFRIDQPGRIRVDVSVVIGNEPTLSLYGHDEFLIDVIYTGVAPTTFSPIAAPSTQAPINVPVPVPLPLPVSVPVAIPGPTPISSDYNRKNKFDVNDYR
jgi:hypothetical protein